MEAQLALAVAEPELAAGRARCKRRREEGFTADVKAYAVERFAASRDAAGAEYSSPDRKITLFSHWPSLARVPFSAGQAGRGDRGRPRLRP